MVIQCDCSLDRFKQELTNLCDPKCQRAIVYAVIFLIVLVHLFFTGFTCSCDPQTQTVACHVYLILPMFIIMLLLLRLDRTFHRALCRLAQSCSCQQGAVEQVRCSTPLWSLVVQLLRALAVSLLWVVSVLFNGSWWVCCRIQGTQAEVQVPCRDSSELTPSDKSILAHLRSLSRASALGVLLAMLILSAGVSVMRVFFKKDGKLSDVIWDEGQNLVFEMVRSAANKRIKEDVEVFISREEWSQCSNVVEDFLKKLQPPNNMRHFSPNQDPPQPSPAGESSTVPPQDTSCKRLAVSQL